MPHQKVSSIVKAIQLGVRWLKSRVDSVSDPRELALCLSALMKAEKSRHSQSVQRLLNRLLQQQRATGSWGDELWDTTWALSALGSLGFDASNPHVSSALRFIEATRDPVKKTWYEEPFETTLVLEVITMYSPERLEEIGISAVKWLLSLQDANGMIIGARYTGMVASLFMSLSFQLPNIAKELSLAASRAVGWLLKDLQDNSIWTNASWSNYYGLRALLDSGCTLDSPAVSQVVDWFLETQTTEGRWEQVSALHDTALAIAVLSRLLTVPLVVLSPARIGVVTANRENGTLRVSFHGPDAGPLAPTERMKVSPTVVEDLSKNQQALVRLVESVRNRTPGILKHELPSASKSLSGQLTFIGKYAYGHLVPARIQILLEDAAADHLRLDIDEALINMPWELIHDGKEFLCLRYALGRRIVSDREFRAADRSILSPGKARALIVSNPTSDLPAAEQEGIEVAKLLTEAGLEVHHWTGSSLSKKDFLIELPGYDIVHYAGHASYNAKNPDESSLHLYDGEVQAFEIGRFLASQAPPVVFLNACWSAEEFRNPDLSSSMARGLGRTFLFAGSAAFLGYIVPVPDSTATRLACEFYRNIVSGQTIAESLRLARLSVHDPLLEQDVTWASAVLYGDPSAKIFATPS